MVRIAHIADVHVRNVKYHDTYRQVFESLYESLREKKPDYIVVCGDIAHTKTSLAPEWIAMAGGFLKNLGDIAPTHVILGNHDGNLRNFNRQDAVTPIVDLLKHPSVFLHKDTEKARLAENIDIHCLSLFDNKDWNSLRADKEKINIALYHGPVVGVKTDLGWEITSGAGGRELEEFKDYDYVFLGDIHRSNQWVDDRGKVRYAGSLVQQNHGESPEKGYLLWDVEDKERYQAEFIQVNNPSPYITLFLNDNGEVPEDANVPAGSYLRIVYSSKIPHVILRGIMDAAKVRFDAKQVTCLHRAIHDSLNGSNGKGTFLDSSIFHEENMRDEIVQEKLIREYLAAYKTDEEVLQEVLKLNARYNKSLEDKFGDEVQRHVHWKIKWWEWGYLFNYGANNRIDMSTLQGTVGITGSNFSGKTSAILSLLYIVFNSTSKNNRKNLHVINQNQNEGWGKACLEINDVHYYIERKSTKYEKKLYGDTTTEAKTEVNFFYIDPITEEQISLNGESRNQTEKNIRAIFGTLEDFLYTSMASQEEPLKYLSEGATRQKEILAKFLDLETFEEKFKAAKEDSASLKVQLKKLEDACDPSQMASFKEELEENEEKISNKKIMVEQCQVSLQEMMKDVATLEHRLSTLPSDVTSNINEIMRLRKEVEAHQGALAIIDPKVSKLQKYVDFTQQELATLEKTHDSMAHALLIGKVQEIDELEKDISQLTHDIQKTDRDIIRLRERTSLLDEVPCTQQYWGECLLVKDARQALQELKNLEKDRAQWNNERTSQGEKLATKNPEDMKRRLVAQETSKRNIESKRNSLQQTKLELQIQLNKKMEIDAALAIANSRILEINAISELVEQAKEWKTELEDATNKLSSTRRHLDEHNETLQEMIKRGGYIEQSMSSYEEKQKELDKIKLEYIAYDFFLKCMHPNGISYNIIRNKLPIINEEISEILANVVDFDVFFETDSDKLDISLRHPKYDPRPLDMGSGSEKSLAAMAIRLALLGVSSLPKPDIFILDEPGRDLDETNLENFARILDMIKTQFQTVFLITHLDSFKDSTDSQITIESSNGYASVNV